jgi:hypothetical protein
MLTIVDDKNIGFALGAADYLTKPINSQPQPNPTAVASGSGGAALPVSGRSGWFG